MVPFAMNDTEQIRQQLDEHPLLLFDGICGLCNTFVDFIIKRDKSERFRFSPLQGEIAREFATEKDREGVKSVVLVTKKGTYRKSAAVVRVLWELGGLWAALGSLLWIIPKPLRDLGYMGMAKIRYQVFGKKTACRMPTPEERTRFLD